MQSIFKDLLRMNGKKNTAILVAIFLMSWEWNKISGAVSFRFVVLQTLNTLLSSVFILSYYYTDPWVFIFAFFYLW